MTIREIKLPEGVNATLNENNLTLEGNGQKLEKKFDLRDVKMHAKDGKIIIESLDEKKKSIQVVGTIEGHAKNMVKGLNEEFTYKLKAEHKHFPLKITVKGNKLEIANFLGQKNAKTAKIPEGVKVEVKGNDITITSRDIEKAGLTASNIENASKQNRLCDRKFLDGVYIVQKP